jgi:phosphohistidine phosphatase
MRVYLVRHAEAEPGTPDDEQRALTPAGKEQARQLADRLAADGVEPDAILTSPLRRARQTAEALGDRLGVRPEADDRLRPGATAARVREVVDGRGDAIVVVGHQPDCGLVAAELTQSEPPKVPPAGFVVLEL